MNNEKVIAIDINSGKVRVSVGGWTQYTRKATEKEMEMGRDMWLTRMAQ